jgi:hypothetical protein
MGSTENVDFWTVPRGIEVDYQYVLSTLWDMEEGRTKQSALIPFLPLFIGRFMMAGWLVTRLVSISLVTKGGSLVDALVDRLVSRLVGGGLGGPCLPCLAIPEAIARWGR